MIARRRGRRGGRGLLVLLAVVVPWSLLALGLYLLLRFLGMIP